LRVLGAIAAGLAAGLCVCGSGDVFGRSYGPKGRLIVAKPTLVWEIWSTGADRIVGATATIDGRPVRAFYDGVAKRITAEPAAPLAPGRHAVEFVVRFSDEGTVPKDWEIEIAPGAITELPGPSPLQLRTMDWVNTFRGRMSLPPVTADPRLHYASTLHSSYLEKNQTTGHFEQDGKPGFIGVNPGDRAAAVGHIGNSWEVVEFGSQTPEEALRNLVDAPYHRLPFLQPDAVSFGSGYAGQRLTATFSTSSSTATVVSPSEGQSDVPLLWDKNERPNPLRIHATARRPTGYPIVFVHFTREPVRITVRSARLADARGAEIPCFLNTPETDTELTNAAFLIPKSPLAPNTVYTVQVSAAAPGGVDLSRTWSFSTRSK